jgi:hypothetical protein
MSLIRDTRSQDPNSKTHKFTKKSTIYRIIYIKIYLF